MWGKKVTANNIGESEYSTNGSTYSSPQLTDSKRFEINKSMVKAFLNIGNGHASFEVFSMSLGILTMDRKTFDKYGVQHNEKSAIEKQTILQQACMKVRDEHKKSSVLISTLPLTSYRYRCIF